MSNQNERCKNCRFYYSTAYDEVCRRYPPVPLEVTEDNSHGPNYHHSTHLVINSYFPSVDDDGWCGEWLAEKEKTDEQETHSG